MSNNTDNISDYLQSFGLEKEETLIYEYLLKHGQASALQISKETSIPRASVYRFLENLLLTQLVTELTTPRGKKFEAGSVHNLQTIIDQRKSEVDNLESSFKNIEKIVKQLSIPDIAKTKVISYEGINGLKQMTWNSYKAEGTLRIIALETMNQFLDYGFAEKARTEFLLNKVLIKELTNLKKFDNWTEITQLATDFWECRYIPKSSFEVAFEILIYNDVYAMYNYQNNDIVGVEIHNEQLADMQRQIFDYLWDGSQPLKLLDKHGRSSI